MAKKLIYSIIIAIITYMSINLTYYKTYCAGALGDIIGGVTGNVSGQIQKDIQSPIDNPDYYAPSSSESTTGTSHIKKIGNSIIGSIRLIGSVLSVLVLMILGIKYMMGSVEEKAEYKKTMMPYVIGVIMVFGITNILSIVIKLAANVF